MTLRTLMLAVGVALVVGSCAPRPAEAPGREKLHNLWHQLQQLLQHRRSPEQSKPPVVELPDLSPVVPPFVPEPAAPVAHSPVPATRSRPPAIVVPERTTQKAKPTKVERPASKPAQPKSGGGNCLIGTYRFGIRITCGVICKYARDGYTSSGETACERAEGLACIRSSCPDVLRKK